MNEATNPVEDSGVSTSPDTDAVIDSEQNLPEGFDELFDYLEETDAARNGVPEDLRAEADGEDEPPEVSEDEPSEDDSNIDDGETEESAGSNGEDTPDSIVDWSEMKEHQFDIDGKVYSANDLKAALGRQTKQEEARKEVESRSKELEAREAQALAREEVLNGRLDTFQKQSHLQSGINQLNQLKAAQNKAAAQNDQNAFNRLQMKIQPLEASLQQFNASLQGEMQQVSEANLKVQMGLLEERGFGNLLTDRQRIETINEYAGETYSPSLLQLADNNAEVLILLDKAQKYDAAQKTGQKRKLKGTSSKNRKAGAGIGNRVKQKPTDSVQATIDSLFS